ncbi:MAG: hypothetical protein ACYSTJ_07725, partial [Planctomycetota bacterium]
ANESKEVREQLKRQRAELVGANEQLQNQLAKYKQEQKALQEDRDQLEQHLKEQIAKLKAADVQLQREITKREQVQEQLVSVQSRLDKINLIVHKHL